MLERILQTFDITTVLFLTIFFLLLEYRPPWWLLLKTKICKNSINSIPGPRSLPVFGTCWLFTIGGGFTFNRLHCYYEYLYKQYGGIVKEEALFNIPIIHLFDKRDIEKVLKSSGKYPLRPPTEAVAYYRKSRPDRYASSGLVNEQGESWYFLRTTLTPALTSPRTISNFLPQAQEIADDWCNLIKHQRDENGRIDDMHQITGRLGLEIACALVLGRRMGFLLPEVETETSRKLADSIQNYFIATRDTYFGIPLWKLFPTKSYKDLINSEETIYGLVLDLIKSADDSTRDSVVYQSIINANIDIRERTAAIIDFIAAGIHTMKNSLLFLLHLVGNNPQIQQNILNDPTKSYLKACLNESFRLYPTAFSLARILEHDMELSGYRLNAGSVVICHTGLACRNEDYFRKAKEFRPERWLNDEKSQTVGNSAFILTPFGLGRRICPGKRLIEQILPVLLENTIKNFQLESLQALETQFEFLLSPKAPVSIRFNDRI